MRKPIENEQNASKCAVLILAAGASKRLGRPKQLVRHKGKTLLENVIEAALSISPRVFVVLGAHFSKIKSHIANYPVVRIQNSNWEEGMGSSIRVGMAAIRKQGDIDSVLLTVCDQPALSALHFQRLFFEKKKSAKEIAASVYDNIIGVPALFSYKYFLELQNMTGDKGAKKLLLRHQEDVVQVNFPEGQWDIDAPKDLKMLN